MTDLSPDPREAWEQLFAREKDILTDRRVSSCQPPGKHGNGAGRNGRDYLIGIGLSGGGIRSATVSLGVMQAFAKAGLIKHIDYMSSVSGGGYTAAAVAMRYAQHADRDCDPDAAFPFGMGDAWPEPDALRHLRSHASYLAPGGLSGIATGFFVVARSLLINLFIWITLGSALLAILMLATRRDSRCLVLEGSPCDTAALFDMMLFTAAGLAAFLVAMMAGFSLSSWRLKTRPYFETGDVRGRYPQVFYLLLLAASVVLTATLARRAGLWPPDLTPSLRFGWFVATVAAALLALAFFAICLGPRLWQGREAAVERKYARRRFQEVLSGWLSLVILGLLVVGSLPVISTVLPNLPALGLPGLSENDPGGLSVLTYLVALATALFGFYRTNLRGTLGLGSACVVVAGSVFVCWSALFLAYHFALDLLPIYGPVLDGRWPTSLHDAVIVLLPLIALALGFFANINDVSLGRFYRDRLMEAFMPDPEHMRDGTTGPAAAADRFKLAEVIPPVAPRPPGEDTRLGRAVKSLIGSEAPVGGLKRTRLLGPYPLINANVMTPWHPDPIVKSRRGDNFVLSPAFCGSSATGWKPIEALMKGRFPLATAMAISGAAANPRGGFAGGGPTTNYAVVVAMSLLNFRLGYWLRWNAAPPFLAWMNPFGNHFIPSALSLLPRHSTGFIELTDGGHFENLGLYELVRRRCGLIIIADGGDDRTASYAAFTVAAQRIKEDFGATFDFAFQVRSEPSGPHQVVARTVDDEYPKAAEYASRGYFLARITYGDPKRARVPMATCGPKVGLVIYLKSAMIRSLSLSARSYKGANADFPYESTADQFFSPEQFEAYRDVGLRTAEQMLEDTNLMHLFDDDQRPSLWSLRSTYGFAGPEDWAPWERPNGPGESPRPSA